MTEESIRVSMIRPDLENLPQYPLPEGYALRLYRPGDERHWLRIQQLADKYNTHTLEGFWKRFGPDPAPLPQRQYFLCAAAGAAVGTASAWWKDDADGQYGLVHWVAIVPELQGRGLSKPLMAAVLNRLRELGHTRAWLNTQTARLPAISLYLKLGFSPVIRTAADRAAWEAVRAKLPGSPLETMPL